MSPRSRTISRRLAAWVAAILISTSVLLAQDGSRNRDRQSPRDAPKRSAKYREGSTIVDQLGQFRQLNADQIEFHFGEGKHVLRVLENLALERIAGELLNNSEPPRWSVSGTITEYQGTNYLLVRRAVLKSKH